MILEAFYQLLKANANVLAVVGNNPPRLHYSFRPQGEREPAVVLQLVSESQGSTMSGPAPYSTGTVRLNVFGRSALEAGDVAGVVRTAVHCFAGTVGGFTFGSIFVDAAGEIPRVVPDGQAGPNVFGIYLDCSFIQKS